MPITSSSISADMGRLLLSVLMTIAVLGSRAQERTVPLVFENSHLYADMQIGEGVRVRALLESGIPYPLIDEDVVRRNPELFDLQKLEAPRHFRMAGGTTYTANYKLAPGVRIGAARTLCESYVVDLQGCDLLFPLQTYTTDSIALPGVFMLDIRSQRLTMLSPGDLTESGDGWHVLKMNRDERSGMFTVAGTLRLTGDEGRSNEAAMNVTVDLGNANLLALFAAKPEIAAFADASPVKKNVGRTSHGVEFRVLQPAVTTFFDEFTFSGQPILLLDKPIRVPGDGFLGTRFFEPYRVIFDFRGGRLWLAKDEE